MAKASKPPPEAPAAEPAPAGETRGYVKYDAKLAETICERIAGGEAWQGFCGRDGMPSYSSLYKWRDSKPAFAKKLAQARDIAADSLAEKALLVAEGATSATASAARLHVTTLLWHAARGAPHRYGSRPENKQPKARQVIVEVRDFVPVTRPDGTVFTREILPDGSFVDGED